MRGNVISYTPTIHFTVKLESGHSWGDLLKACKEVKADLSLYSGFTWTCMTVNHSDAILPSVNFQCNLKPNTSLAMAEMTIYTTLNKHSIGGNDGKSS